MRLIIEPKMLQPLIEALQLMPVGDMWTDAMLARAKALQDVVEAEALLTAARANYSRVLQRPIKEDAKDETFKT